MIITAEMVSTQGITDEQIGKAHKIIASAGNYYMVENSKGEIDPATGYVKEYKVSWSKARGFQCQCKAAENGRLCWHIRASVACEMEVKAAIGELEAAIKEQAAPVAKIVTNLDSETLKRVQAACEAPRKVSKAKAPEYRGFSLLR